MAARYAIRLANVPPTSGGDEVTEVWVTPQGITALNDVCEYGSVASAWPVGSVYGTDTDSNPAALLGVGTWQALPGNVMNMNWWKRTA